MMKVIHGRDLARCPLCGGDQFEEQESRIIHNPFPIGKIIGTSILYRCLECHGEWIVHSLGTIDQCLPEEVE